MNIPDKRAWWVIEPDVISRAKRKWNKKIQFNKLTAEAAVR